MTSLDLMPKSRSRRNRNRSERQRKQGRRSRATRKQSQCWSLNPKHFSLPLGEILTEDDHREMALCADAEARGEAAAALEHFLSRPYVVGSLQLHHLREIVNWGSEAPAWPTRDGRACRRIAGCSSCRTLESTTRC